MGKAILMDQTLKLIVEEVSVTRADQISSLLKVDHDVIVQLLKEMENAEHIRLVKVGSKGIYVIVLNPSGRQFYKSSSYAELVGDAPEEKGLSRRIKISRRTITWLLIDMLLVILAIVGYNQRWFS